MGIHRSREAKYCHVHNEHINETMITNIPPVSAPHVEVAWQFRHDSPDSVARTCPYTRCQTMCEARIPETSRPNHSSFVHGGSASFI